MTARKLGSFTSGESEAVTGSGPSEPATKRRWPVCVRNVVRGLSRHSRGRTFISWTSRAEIGVVHHALEKFRIFAPAFRFALKKKIVQADRGGAESIGFDDVRAGFEILARGSRR